MHVLFVSRESSRKNSPRKANENALVEDTHVCVHTHTDTPMKESKDRTQSCHLGGMTTDEINLSGVI